MAYVFEEALLSIVRNASLSDVDPSAKTAKWNARIVGLLQDATGEGWIALQRLYTARELEARGHLVLNQTIDCLNYFIHLNLKKLFD